MNESDVNFRGVRREPAVDEADDTGGCIEVGDEGNETEEKVLAVFKVVWFEIHERPSRSISLDFSSYLLRSAATEHSPLGTTDSALGLTSSSSEVARGRCFE